MKKNRILLTAFCAALILGAANLSNEAYSHNINKRYNKNVKVRYVRPPHYAQAQIRIHTPIGSFYSGTYNHYPLMHRPMPYYGSSVSHTTITNIYL